MIFVFQNSFRYFLSGFADQPMNMSCWEYIENMNMSQTHGPELLTYNLITKDCIQTWQPKSKNTTLLYFLLLLLDIYVGKTPSGQVNSLKIFLVKLN